MNSKRYQLWMRLVSHSPGNPDPRLPSGQANFTYRIIDTQAADFRSQQVEVLNDGYSFLGQSEDVSRLEDFVSAILPALLRRL